MDSCTSYSDYIDYAAKLRQKAICFTEHGNIFNWIKKKIACEKKGLKYLHGVECYLTRDHNDRERDNYHTILIARNYDGVKEINKLVSASYNAFMLIDPDDFTDHFYYKPRISFNEFFKISHNVIKISACLASPLNNVSTDDPSYERLVKSYDYLEIQPHNSKDQIVYNRHLLQLSQQYHIPLIAGTDTHSLNAYKAECRTILQYAKGIEFSGEDSFDLTYKSLPELIEMFRKQDAIPEQEYLQAIENTNVMADSVEDFELDLSFKYPKLYGDSQADKEMLLKTEREKFIAKRKAGIIPDDQAQAFIDAMKEENRVFEKVDMMGFMLFMSEMVSWCKSHDIPIGFNRGSCGGSRVAYVTDIIDLNPEQWHTVFSRFCNEDRKEIGDIDIDVSPSDRDKVYAYIINRFTQAMTAYILSVGTVSSKGTIDEIGRALSYIWEKDNLIDEKSLRKQIKECRDAGEDTFKIESELAYAKDFNKEKAKENPYALDKIAKIKEEFSRNEGKAREKYPDVFYYYDGLIDTPISQSMHPAGIVASPVTLADNYGVLVNDGKVILQIDMDCVHEVSLVKYDILGLKNIEIIKDACNIAGIPYPYSHEINWNDEAVWKDMLRSPVGIFEFESAYSFQLLRDYEPHSIFDMSLVTAALRPSGASYRNDLMNHKVHHNISPIIDELLKENYGYLVYQEDVIKFLTEICGFTGSEADNTRRAIARKDEERLKKVLPEIVNGYCNKSSQPREIAEQEAAEFVQIIEDASSYMFGRNHSIGYCMIGYLCAYLRYYYPHAFITAYLNNANGDDDLKAGSELAQEYGVTIVPPKFGESKDIYVYNPEHNLIAKGVASVKYLNANVANRIYQLSHDKQYTHFVQLLRDLIVETGINTRQLDVLIKIDFFSHFGNQVELQKLVELMELFKYGDIKSISKVKVSGKYFEQILMKYVTGLTKAGKEAAAYTFAPGQNAEMLEIEISMLKKKIKFANGFELDALNDDLQKAEDELQKIRVSHVMRFLMEVEDQIKSLHLKDLSMKLKMQNQLDLLGYIDLTTGKQEDRRKLLILKVIPLNNKGTGEPWGYAVFTRSIGTGNCSRLTVRAAQFNNSPLRSMDIIFANTVKKNAKGFWYLYDYERVVE